MIPIGTTIVVNFTTANPTTGVPQNADSLPTVAVYEDANDTPILQPTPVNRATGEYRVAVACTVGNSFEVGKTYNVVASATVATVSGKRVLATFLVELAVADAILAADVQGLTVKQSLAAGALNASGMDTATMTVKYADGTTAFTRTLTHAQLDAISAMVP